VCDRDRGDDDVDDNDQHRRSFSVPATTSSNLGFLLTPQSGAVTTHTHTHPFNGSFSGTTQVSRYTRKVKTSLDFIEARDSEWQWHQLGHIQVCISLQTDNHASTLPLVFTGRMPFLPPNQQRQRTEGCANHYGRIRFDRICGVGQKTGPQIHRHNSVKS